MYSCLCVLCLSDYFEAETASESVCGIDGVSENVNLSGNGIANGRESGSGVGDGGGNVPREGAGVR